MLIYYVIFIVPMLFYLTQNKEVIKKNFTDYFILSFLALLLLGLRTKTGADWSNYLRNFKSISRADYLEIFEGGPQDLLEFSNNSIFWLLNAIEPDYGYYLYHIIAMMIGLIALYVFAKEQPYFWLTIGIAVPFFILVMIMGYTRQGIALSFIMMGLNYLKRFKVFNFFCFVAVATTFHASAITMSFLALPYLFHKDFRYKNLVMIIVFILVVVGFSFFQAYLDKKSQEYIAEAMISVGTLPRVAITVLAAVFLFAYRQRWQQVFHDYQLWRMYALAALFTLPALAVLPSTSVDRIALYLLPLQLAVWPRIIYLAGKQHRDLLALGVIAGYGITLHIWLNYAKNIWMWVPFKHLFFYTPTNYY